MMRILIGVVSVLFGLQYLLGLQARATQEHRPASATFFGALAGFTSFSIHAGGPPLTMYLMPKQLAPLLFAGTAGLFFAVVNAVKLVPYYALGQFSSTNLLYSLVLVPLAPLGVWLGHFLVRRSPAGFFPGSDWRQAVMGRLIRDVAVIHAASFTLCPGKPAPT